MPVSRKIKSITTAAAAAAGAALIVTGTAGAAAGTVSGVASTAPAGVQLAAADTSSTSGTSGTAGPSTSAGSSGSGSGSTDPTGPADSAERPDPPKPGKDLATTAITGSEVDKVVAAVKAEDAAVTAAGAVKLSDGSYRVEGTKSGERVMVEVSKDLATVTVRNPGPGGPGGPGRHGGPGGDRGTDVTGDQLTKIKAAVTAKDSTVTLDRVVKLDDGSYVGFGSKGSGDSATRVFAKISGDLKTITVESAPDRPGHPHAPGDR